MIRMKVEVLSFCLLVGTALAQKTVEDEEVLEDEEALEDEDALEGKF